MNLQEKLTQLAVEREQLVVALHELTGAMKILQQQVKKKRTNIPHLILNISTKILSCSSLIELDYAHWIITAMNIQPSNK